MSWFVLRVKAKHEQNVSWLLAIRSVESFVPSYNVRRKWADRQMVLRMPLFPGYVFCRFLENQQSMVAQTPGVVEIVSFGRAPARVDDDEILALQRVASSNCGAEPWPALIPGESVEITAGPLIGLCGVVIQHKAALRLVLSVTLLQRSVLVEIESRHVAGIRRPIGKASQSSPNGACFRDSVSNL